MGASDCVSAWNAQEGESRVEETFFPVSEGESDAWVSIYEGHPVGHENPVSGLVEGVKSGDCLVVLGDTGEEGPVVWSYEPQSEFGFWSLAEEGAGGPLYEFGRNSQAATRGEITKGGKLRLADAAESGDTAEATEAGDGDPSLGRCVDAWNGADNLGKQEELGGLLFNYKSNPDPRLAISIYEGAPYESTFGSAESAADVGVVRRGDCIVAPVAQVNVGTGSFFAEIGPGHWILGEFIAGGSSEDSVIEPYVPFSDAETNGWAQGSEPEEGVRLALIAVE
jgi:hypothetical protein